VTAAVLFLPKQSWRNCLPPPPKSALHSLSLLFFRRSDAIGKKGGSAPGRNIIGIVGVLAMESISNIQYCR
jgi:hypothetical protein